jgi:hypothetical protein
MRICSFLIGLCLLVAPTVSAQRLSGQGTCGEPEDQKEIPVGDRPNHSFAVSKSKCSWIRPFEIGGQRAEGGTAVQINERSRSTSKFRGDYLDPMSGGDTVHYSYEGTTTFAGEKPQKQTWSWTIVAGTGKLKGVSGKGTCNGAWPEDKFRWSCTGAYRLPK